MLNTILGDPLRRKIDTSDCPLRIAIITRRGRIVAEAQVLVELFCISYCPKIRRLLCSRDAGVKCNTPTPLETRERADIEHGQEDYASSICDGVIAQQQ